MLNLRKNAAPECSHQRRSVTTYFGLERRICDACGDVAIAAVAGAEPGVLFQEWKQIKPWGVTPTQEMEDCA